MGILTQRARFGRPMGRCRVTGAPRSGSAQNFRAWEPNAGAGEKPLIGATHMRQQGRAVLANVLSCRHDRKRADAPPVHFPRERPHGLLRRIPAYGPGRVCAFNAVAVLRRAVRFPTGRGGCEYQRFNYSGDRRDFRPKGHNAEPTNSPEISALDFYAWGDMRKRAHHLKSKTLRQAEGRSLQSAARNRYGRSRRRDPGELGRQASEMRGRNRA